MSNLTFFLFFIPFLAILLLTINLVFAPHNPYGEKKTSFECGFHSFLGQNRTQFSISFFIFALLFLLFDLEILLIYPYSVSSYINGVYGLIVMLLFFVLLTLGFIFELGKKALDIPSRQSDKTFDKSDPINKVIIKQNSFDLSEIIPTLVQFFSSCPDSMEEYMTTIVSFLQSIYMFMYDQT